MFRELSSTVGYEARIENIFNDSENDGRYVDVVKRFVVAIA